MQNAKAIVAAVSRTAKKCCPGWRFCFLGPAFVVVAFTYTHYSFGSQWSILIFSFADVMCLVGMALALIFLAAARTAWFYEHKSALVVGAFGCAALGFIGDHSNLFLPLGASRVLTLMGAISLELYVVVLIVFWFEVYRGLALETVSCSLLASIVLGSLLSWFLMGMQFDRRVVGMLLIMLLSGLALLSALNSAVSKGEEEAPAVPFPASPLVVAFLFSFSFMLSVSFVGFDYWYTDTGWSIFWPAAFVLGAIALFFKRINIGTLLYVALMLVVTGILLASFMHVGTSLILSLASMGFSVHVAYMIILFSEFSKHSKWKPVQLASFLILAVYAGCILGRPVAWAIEAYAQWEMARMLIVTGLIVGVIACTLLCMNSRTIVLYSKYRFRQPGQSKAKPICQSALITEYAIECRLGDREQEALGLLLQGKTAAQIADEMFVAHGTAKAHIRHIYRKFGIHTREELFSLMRALDPSYHVKS